MPHKLLIVFVLLFTDNLFAEDDSNESEPVCEVTSELQFQPIVDDSGKEILTSKKIFKHCVKETNVRGTCIKWLNEEYTSKMPEAKGVAVEEYESMSDVSAVLASVEAINRANVIFSGTKGYCEKGWTADYSWLDDPLFWASITMQVIAAMGEDVDANKAKEEKNLASQEKTAALEKLDANVEAYEGQVAKIEDLADAQVNDLQASDLATQKYNDAYNSGLRGDDLKPYSDSMFDAQNTANVSSANWNQAIDELDNYETAIGVSIVDAENAEYNYDLASTKVDMTLDNQTGLQKFARYTTEGYSGCAVTGALGMLGAAYDYLNKDDVQCDPVDEFCAGDGDTETADDPSMIQTLTQDEFDNMIRQKPELENALEIIKIEVGYITFKIKSTGELVDTNEVNMDDLQAAQDLARQKQFELRSAVTAVSMATCMGVNAASVNFGSGDSIGSASAGNSNMKDTATGIVTGAVTSLIPFPFNTIATVAQNLYNTWERIDSCNDEDDATSSGGRHVKAYRGIRYNTCHPIANAEIVERWPITKEKMREAYRFCCYESPISKILMVQIKAQLGKGWTHCTDVTLNELSHVKFVACTPEQKNPASNGGYKDGEDFRGVEFVDYDMKDSYQFKYQCMNLNGLQDYIRSQVQIDFSDTQINDFLDNFSTGE